MVAIPVRSLHHPWPVAVATLGVLVTLALGFAASHQVERRIAEEFSYKADRTAAAIQQRLDTYQEVLRGLQGFFVGSSKVDRSEFRAYVDLLRLSERYPGAQEFWFARHVSAEERADYEARVRRDLASRGEASDVTINPPGMRDEYLVVEYVYPLAENRRFMGSDLLTVPERKSAIARTRKTHELVLTGRLSDMDGAAHYALVAAIPPSGGREFVGTVSMVFRPAEVVATATKQQGRTGLAFEIYDNAAAAAQGDAAQRVLGHDGELGEARYRRTLPLRIGDREWALVVTALPAYSAAAMETWLPPILFSGGIIVTLLLYLLAVFLVAGRQRAESRFGGTFDFVPDGLLVVSESGIIQRANPQAEALFGYGSGELAGRPLEALLPKDKQTVHADLHAEFFANPNPVAIYARDGDVFGCARNGRVFPVEVGLAPLETEGSKTMIAAVRDVTDRVQAACALENANRELMHERETLARRVSERTAELAAANEALQQEMQVKQDFLATMSHEIRTPLNGMLGILELLSLSALTIEQRHELAIASESGKSLARIIDDILDFSKIEAGKLQLSIQPENLRQLIDSVRNAQLSVASARGISLMSFVDPRIRPLLLLDSLRMKQVLQNLVSNAIKFTSAGYVEIRAELVEHSDTEDTVRLTVRDTGIGIAPESLVCLFDRFTQADAGTARRYGGTGLGLSICKMLVEMMGGNITVASKLGEGSAFSITLTFTVVETGKVPLTTPSAAPETVARLSSGGLPVLAVDDHPTNRALLARQLGLLGLTVELAENGNQALDKWRRGSYCLVLTDCHMPGVDGFELARVIREIELREGRPHMPIIAWTAAALHDEVQRCHVAGMDDVLLKPSELVELRQTLARWLPFAPANAADMADAAPVAQIQSRITALAGSLEDEAVILHDFITQTRRDLAALEAALAAGDLDAATHEAHRINGASRMVGAQMLVQSSMKLEQILSEGDMEKIRHHLTELQAGFADLHARFAAAPGENSGDVTGHAGDILLVWDDQVLTAMIGNSPKFHRELLDSFFESSKSLLVQIRSVYEKRESKPVARLAHKFKSVAAAVGAQQLAFACAELEQAANTDNPLAIAAAYDRLQNAYSLFAALHQRVVL